MAEPGPAAILIVGGGVALETPMGGRDLAGDRVRLTLVAAEPEFVRAREPVAEPGRAPEGFADLEVPPEAADAAPDGR